MEGYILTIFIAIVVIFVFTNRGKTKAPNPEQTERKNENLDRIVKLLETKDQITNTDVEELLGVGDSTATRYLEELEQRGLIKQIGDRGKYVYYEKA